jgi:transcription termination factor NusB
MKKRTRARELALQFLYQLDPRAGDPDEAGLFPRVDRQVRARVRDPARQRRGRAPGPDRRRHPRRRPELEIGRMAVIDRNVLRMAFELPLP